MGWLSASNTYHLHTWLKIAFAAFALGGFALLGLIEHVRSGWTPLGWPR